MSSGDGDGDGDGNREGGGAAAADFAFSSPSTLSFFQKTKLNEKGCLGLLLRASNARLFHSSTHIVMGGGAIYGMMYIGVLMELCGYDKRAFAGWLHRLRAVAGTSAGTVIGLMLAAGMDPWEMRSVVHTSGLTRVMDGLLDITLSDLQHTNAVTSGRRVDGVVQDLVKRVTGRVDTTFQQFYASTGRNFVVVVTNADTSMSEFWNHETQPHLELWRAIRCSTSIPGLFPPPVVKGVAFFDGGVTCNLPCHLFPPHTTLSLFVHAVFKQPTHTKLIATILHGLMIYMSSAQLGPMRMSHVLAFRAIPCCVYSADTGILGPYAFDVSAAAMDDLIRDGCRSARAVLIRDLLLSIMLFIHVLVSARVKGRGKGKAKASGNANPSPERNIHS